MNREEIKDLITIGFNLNQKVGRNILTKKYVEKLIDNEVEKYLKTENESNNN